MTRFLIYVLPLVFKMGMRIALVKELITPGSLFLKGVLIRLVTLLDFAIKIPILLIWVALFMWVGNGPLTLNLLKIKFLPA